MMLSEVAKLTQAPTGAEAAKLQAQVNRGKKRSKRLAEASGLLGLGALGLRAPQVANAVARRSTKLAATPAIKRLGALAPHATKLSEASVPLSIGTGAIGSFNYAHQMGRENKLAPKPVVKKADDRFLRANRDRISPSAEKGYEYLRRGRNNARRQATVSGSIAAGNALGAAYYLKKKNPMMAGAATLLAAGSGANAFDRGMQAHRWNKQKMGPIKAKAYQRREEGLYAPGRGKHPVDRTSRAKDRTDDLSKALWKVPRVPGIKPAVRPGGLMRLSSGKTVTRRGAIPGAGRLF